MGEFKRRPGQSLGLRLDLKPAPDATRYVTAFLFDKGGTALVPASVNLTDIGDGVHVDNSTVMQSTAQMVAKYKVYFDAPRADLDDCEYLGSTDQFDLDELVASQLPPDSTLTGHIQGEVKLGGELKQEKIQGEMKDMKLTGTVEDPEQLEATDDSANVSGEINEEKIEGNIE